MARIARKIGRDPDKVSLCFASLPNLAYLAHNSTGGCLRQKVCLDRNPEREAILDNRRTELRVSSKAAAVPAMQIAQFFGCFLSCDHWPHQMFISSSRSRTLPFASCPRQPQCLPGLRSPSKYSSDGPDWTSILAPSPMQFPLGRTNHSECSCRTQQRIGTSTPYRCFPQAHRRRHATYALNGMRHRATTCSRILTVGVPMAEELTLCHVQTLSARHTVKGLVK
jgi:hypothetical protein